MPEAHGRVEIRYRPVVDVEEVADLVDVQQLLLLLEQEDGPARLVEIGRKRLPGAGDEGEGPNWGYVRRVADDAEGFDDLLGDWTYRTAGQGERHQSATRVAAHGRWSLTGDDRDTLLTLEVEPAVDDDALLRQLRVERRAVYGVTVKNPRAASDAGLAPEERPDYPEELQAVFDGNRWTAAAPLALLDRPGAELLLVPRER